MGTDRFSQIIVAETLILLFQLFHYLSRRREKSRLLFLFLASSFVTFNIINYIFLFTCDASFFMAKIASYVSCLILVTFHTIYVVNEFGFREEVSSLTNIALGIGTSLLTSYIASHFLFGSSELARLILVALPLILTTLLSIYINTRIRATRKEIRDQKIPFKILLYSSYATLILISAIPLSIYLDYYEANIYIINVAFASVVVGYYQRLLSKNIGESEFLEESKDDAKLDLKDFGLTKQQKVVAELILKGISYAEISKTLNITGGAVTKHASDIFKKTGCSSRKREEFLEKFRRHSN